MDKAAAAPPVSALEWSTLALGVLLWLAVITLRTRARPCNRIVIAGLVTAACLFTTIALGAILTTHRPALAELMNRPWFILPMVAFSVLAYFAQRSLSLAYGAGEIVLALLMFWFAVRTHNDSLFVKGIALSAGVFVFVRGMETIRRSLPRG